MKIYIIALMMSLLGFSQAYAEDLTCSRIDGNMSQEIAIEGPTFTFSHITIRGFFVQFSYCGSVERVANTFKLQAKRSSDTVDCDLDSGFEDNRRFVLELIDSEAGLFAMLDGSTFFFTCERK